jgi:hypothetical protein
MKVGNLPSTACVVQGTISPFLKEDIGTFFLFLPPIDGREDTLVWLMVHGYKLDNFAATV